MSMRWYNDDRKKFCWEGRENIERASYQMKVRVQSTFLFEFATLFVRPHGNKSDKA